MDLPLFPYIAQALPLIAGVMAIGAVVLLGDAALGRRRRAADQRPAP